MTTPTNIDFSKMRSDIADAMQMLNTDEIIKAIQTQITNPTNLMIIKDQASRNSVEMALFTYNAYCDFNDAAYALQQLKDEKDKWLSGWESQRQVCVLGLAKLS